MRGDRMKQVPVERFAELRGYGITNDAYHMTAPRPEGTQAAAAMRRALATGGVAPDEIDYVNAHASSTPLGDVAEARALALALGERARTVPVSGPKALYGHPLGASSAIEASIVALGMQRGWMPGTPTPETPDPAGVDPPLHPVPKTTAPPSP